MRTFFVSLRFILVTTVLLGLCYPLFILGIAQLGFQDGAMGSLITQKQNTHSNIVGSHLIGQNFEDPRYFKGRPSVYSPGHPYDGLASGGSNLSPSGELINKTYAQRAAAWEIQRPGIPVPLDLLSASASSLDPDISPSAAFYQAPIIAKARGINETIINRLIEVKTQHPTWGLIGTMSINVLEINLALDALDKR